MFRNSAHFPNHLCLRTTSDFFVGKSERTRQNAQISILTRIECRNPSSFIEDTQTILPLFQGNIRCLLPVVVAEHPYL